MLLIPQTKTIQMIFKSDPLTKILSNKSLKYKEHNKSLSRSFKSLSVDASICVETVPSKLLWLLLKDVLLRNLIESNIKIKNLSLLMV